MTPAEKRIADAYAAIQDRLPPMMRSEFREHWLGAIREFGACCLEAAAGKDETECSSFEALLRMAETVRAWA